MAILSPFHRRSLPTAVTRSPFPLRWVIFFLLLAGGGSVVRGQPPAASREYQIKAVFLYNFVQFTEWPTNAFLNTNSPVVIGVLGGDPFGKWLDEAVHHQKKNGRVIQVERFQKVEEITNCHALFVSSSEETRMPQILAALRDRPILTVGETDDFVKRGGMIQFATEKNRIRLRINVNAAKVPNLSISSKLLRLADTDSE
jgi:hypothetical protein